MTGMDSELDLGTVSRVMPKRTHLHAREDRVSNSFFPQI